MSRPVVQTVAGLALGMATLQRRAPVSRVRGGPGVLYVGDAAAHPASVGPQTVATLTELGWHWDESKTCWVAPAP